MIPGPLQMLAAISLAFVFRLNLPMAVVGTFFTNPLTIVPLYMTAYGIGQKLSGAEQWNALPPLPETQWQALWTSMQAWWDWIASLGTPWIIGMLILSFGLALASYLLMQLIWRGSRYWNLIRLQSHRRQRSLMVSQEIDRVRVKALRSCFAQPAQLQRKFQVPSQLQTPTLLLDGGQDRQYCESS